jgi:hypothetical protein
LIMPLQVKDASGTTQNMLVSGDGNTAPFASHVRISDGTNDTSILTASTDAASNTNNALPTVSRNMVFNGATWDRLRSGIIAAQSLATGILNTLGMGRYNATPPSLSDGQLIAFQLDASGALKTSPQATVSGGCLGFSSIDVNATGLVVKSSGGQIFWLWAYNAGNATRYLKLYNKATAPSNRDTPVFTFGLGPNGGGILTIPVGQSGFSNGIGIRATTLIASSDNTSPNANEVSVNGGYF